MMGTLAALLAGRKIATPETHYRAEVEGNIEKVNDILKITATRVRYYLRAAEEKQADARECFSTYIKHCPAAQSVLGCIKIEDELIFEN